VLTRAYSSTVYTSLVFHKTLLYGNVRWNQSSGGLILPRRKRPSRGVYWSIFTPALIRCGGVPKLPFRDFGIVRLSGLPKGDPHCSKATLVHESGPNGLAFLRRFH
jgi:hypothetical protein